MVSLALSILFSSLIFVIFKLFSVYKIQTLYAIITNYVVASITGFLLYDGDARINEIPSKSWFWGTLALGFLFIFVFNIMAKTSQKIGVSVASVATKMSLVIPVLFGLLLYNEKLSVLKGVGILLALAAVYFVSVKERTIQFNKEVIILPLLLFLGSGAIDTSIKYAQETQLENNELPIFSATVFGSAAIVGIIFILIKAPKEPLKINFKNILGGIALGVPNYFSIFFLLKALQNDSLNSASIFTLNNVAIVLFSTLLGIILFKEKISLKNWGGITLAVVSILLVALF
ncbi:drug/metabolite transporter (DMT)-like permease [Saonia flava]|uniref:Drug/metabolite transporter (DMT)-like permease n=1 Tax=Saonia flava TaxID=523696 RepID=A0A846QQW6_9FLAO|nr:DMT family transporter [Saonia flava]NJB70541.1 drug/metabolite transporter (DMT)-like permease [Saonia flava]